MVNDIFDPNDGKDGKEYEKLSASEAKIEKEKQRGFLVEDEDDDIVMGEPVFYNNHGNHKNHLWEEWCSVGIVFRIIKWKISGFMEDTFSCS